MKVIKLVEQYLDYRKSFGEAMKVNEECLKLFCRRIGENTMLSSISSKNVKDFLYSSDSITLRWFSKYTALKGFYHYAISRGYIQASPLPKKLPKKPPAFVPYIYTREELRRIFKAVLTYKNKNRGHLDPSMVRVVLILLYSTGLRLHEALALTLADVDLSKNLIRVRETKFYKTRLVPFGIQLAAVITEYLCWRKKQKHSQLKEAPFFISNQGKAVCFQTIEFIFRRIRKIASIHRIDKASYQPRLHDLRHTFAVHRLTSWYQEQANVQMLLPILSTYLGHAQLAATSVYLTMTDELLREAGIRFEQYAIGGSQ